MSDRESIDRSEARSEADYIRGECTYYSELQRAIGILIKYCVHGKAGYVKALTDVKALTEKEALDLTDGEKEVLRDLYDKAVATVERAIRPPKIRQGQARV